MALGDFAGALAIADDDLRRMQKQEIRCYLPDVLRIRGEALRRMGRVDEAIESLNEARHEAERQGCKRGLWSILAKLAEIERERNNVAEADDLRREAGRILIFLSDQADSAGLREAFSAMPGVRAVLDAM